jgi:AraC-like DNA-binding protein
MTPIALDWLHLAALLGAIQGVFLVSVLATQRRNQTANRLLAVAMLAFSLHLTSTVYYAAGLVEKYPHFFGVSYPSPLLYGPLVYLYAVTASDRTRRLGWRDWLHFVPYALAVVAMLPVLLQSGADKVEFYRSLQRGVTTPLIKVVDPLKFVSGLAYAVVTLLFLRRHRQRVKESYASLERVNLQWLFQIGLGSAAIWALATSFELAGGLGLAVPDRADDVVSLAIAVLVYATGYMALRQPEIFNYAAVRVRTAEHPIVAPPAASFAPPALAAVPAPVDAPVPVVPRYDRSGLTDEEASELRTALVDTMEREQLYKDSDLTLADLADRLDTTPHKLSEVLNAELGQTFYDFVNGYRVRDVQRRIADDSSRNLKILALAMDAGFASKSTFNAVFRQHTGVTPSSYRRGLTQTPP